jgi:NAD(P) transhydrogenase subunit alpha
VRANDTRAEVADQVKSLGGEFVKVDYEEEGSGGGGYEGDERRLPAGAARDVRAAGEGRRHHHHHRADPGKPAPKLITAEMVQSMKPGSVIVDMAAEQGGNCELTVPGEAVVRHGVTIVGYTDLASQSSTLYATNLLRLTEELCKAKDGTIDVDLDDDAIRGLTVIKEGTVTWPAPPLKQPAAPQARGRRTAAAAPAKPRPRPQQRADVGQGARDRVRGRRARVPAGRPVRAGQLPVALHGVRAGLLHRLHGDLERDAVAAHAADERDQRDLVDHRHRRAGAPPTAEPANAGDRPSG